MASKRNVKYVEQQEPSFLKKFKERVGYKEPANVDDKFSNEENNPEDDSVENEREIEEEEPVIVVLKHGDLSAEEVAKHKKENDITGNIRGRNMTQGFQSILVQIFEVGKERIEDSTLGKGPKGGRYSY